MKEIKTVILNIIGIALVATVPMETDQMHLKYQHITKIISKLSYVDWDREDKAVNDTHCK